MDEFKKPYEYFEEKGAGGIMLILFFMLISVEPILGIMAGVIWNGAFKGSGAISAIFICAAVIYILFSLFAGLSLKKLRRYAVVAAKAFLVYRLLFLAPAVYISMKMQIDAIPYDKAYVEYAISYRSILTSFIISIAYAFIFSVGWYIYLVRSQKVRNLFPKKETGLKTVA